jgi:ABC-type lipoprotein release transport system permease subunit
MATPHDPKIAGAYLPLDMTANDSVMIAARIAGDQTPAANILREFAARTEPLMRLDAVRSLDRVREFDLRGVEYWTRLTLAVSMSALILSLSGIYAVMSFAVSRRLREIGIRVALGASRPRILAATLRQPLFQLAVGLFCGGVLTFVMTGQVAWTLGRMASLSGYLFGATLICALACIVPIRRALAVDPIDVLRSE